MTEFPTFTPGGLPPQLSRIGSEAVFTEAYALIPGAVLSDITASVFPGWDNARGWILARPMTGFTETFAHCLMQIHPGGGATEPEPDRDAEGALFVTDGEVELGLETPHTLRPGGFAYLPPGRTWTLRSSAGATLHWIRKAYAPLPGEAPPDPIVSSDAAEAPVVMPDAPGWSTRRFMDPADLRHDMHVTIVTLEPGAQIPFLETHVMEHTLHVIEGHGLYRLNRDWAEVGPGDTMILRAFCPQGCVAKGPGPFRYLLYKDVNRHPSFAFAMTRELRAQPLTPAAFAPFGEVLEAAGAPEKIINQGKCQRFHDRAALDFSDGRAGVSLFLAEPRALPYQLDLLERHPDGSQTFVPMHQHPFLVIAAEDAAGAPSTPVAFLTNGAQAISFRRGVWHGVLTPLAAPGLFAVIDRIGPGDNLEEHWLDAPIQVGAPA